MCPSIEIESIGSLYDVNAGRNNQEIGGPRVFRPTVHPTCHRMICARRCHLRTIGLLPLCAFAPLRETSRHSPRWRGGRFCPLSQSRPPCYKRTCTKQQYTRARRGSFLRGWALRLFLRHWLDCCSVVRESVLWQFNRSC
jgi:hypothetical protein